MARPSKLNRAQVAEIRAASHDQSVSYGTLGKRYGVSQSCIVNIVQGLTWKERGFTAPLRRARAKLTWPIVREIRRRYAEGERGNALAAEYGVSNVAVHFVVIGKNWRHDPAGFVYEPVKRRAGATPKLTPADLERICAAMKKTAVQLAMEYEVSEATISKVRNGKYRRAA